MERADMLATLDDLHGDMVFVKKYSRDGGNGLSRANLTDEHSVMNFTEEHMEALRLGILELKGGPERTVPIYSGRPKQASDMPDDEEDNG